MTAVLRSYFRESLALNTYLLIGMRVFGAATGLLYWAIAARSMTAAEVGLASGAVSAATLLAGLAQLGLGYGLVRDLPHERDKNGLINFSILASGAAAVVLVVIALLSLRFWSNPLQALQTNPAYRALFVALTLGTALSQLFQWVFLATNHLSFSLWKISIQSILAIVLLLLFLPFLDGAAANISAYMLSTVLSLALCFFPMLPAAHPEYRFSWNVRAGLRRSFAGYSLSNFVSDQFQRLPDTVLPLLVLQHFGVEAGAYFFVVWSIGRGMVAWVHSVAESLFAAGSRQPSQAHGYGWRAARIGLLLSLGLIGGTWLCGRLLLSLYGQAYIEQGVGLLQIITWSAPVSVLIYTAVSLLRIQRRLRPVAAIMSSSAGLGLVGSLAGMQWGFAGVGLGWLGAQLAVFIGVAAWWLHDRHIRRAA